MQALREEIRRLAINERVIYNQSICIYTRVSWLHLTPTKMGLALHYHGELKLKNGRDGRERDTKRKMELFPQALALLQALQMCSSCLQNAKDEIPSAKTEEKGVTWHISEKGRLAKGSHGQAQATKQGQNWQLPPGAWLALDWRLVGAWLAVCSAWHLLRVARHFLLTFFFFSLLFRVTH